MKFHLVRQEKFYLPGIVMLLGLVMGLLYSIAPLSLIALTLGIIGLAALWVMYFKPHWVILFLVIYLPFEEIILKYAPIPDNVYIAARFLGELLIYVTFVLFIINKVINQEKFRRTPIDVYLMAFILVVGLTILVNRPPLLGSLVNLRSLLRYTVLFYLVSNLDLTDNQIRKILKIIIVTGIVELVIGALQLAFEARINPILLPRDTEIKLGDYSRDFILLVRGREVGSIFGTLGDTYFFALYMAIVLAVYLGQIEKVKIHHLLFVFLIFLSINYAYMRAVVFGVILVLILHYRMRSGRIKTISLLSVLFLIGLSGSIMVLDSTFVQREYISPVKQKQSFLQNLTGVFTLRYLEIAQFQRLGTLTGIPPIVLSDSPLLGYGPDHNTTLDRLNANLPKFDLPLMKKESFTTRGFEDVYWAAMLAYYGLLGLSTFVMIFYRFYTSFLEIYKKTHYALTRNLAVTSACIVGLGGFLLFFYGILEFRSYSFYFWLIPGLLYSLYSREVRLAAAQDRQS